MYLLSRTLEPLLALVQNTSIPHPIGRTTLIIICIHFIPFSILVISSLTNPGSREQDKIILMFLIQDFCECVTGIFSLVTSDDIIYDSGVLDKDGDRVLKFTKYVYGLAQSPLNWLNNIYQGMNNCGLYPRELIHSYSLDRILFPLFTSMIVYYMLKIRR